MPRLILPALAALALFTAQPAAVETAQPYSGTKVIDTGQPFAPSVKRLLGAVGANGLGVVELDAMAKDLDGIFVRIARDVMAAKLGGSRCLFA